MKAILALALIALAGCVAKDASGTTTAQGNLTIYPDSVHGVVCYSASGYRDISCVKVSP